MIVIGKGLKYHFLFEKEKVVCKSKPFTNGFSFYKNSVIILFTSY